MQGDRVPCKVTVQHAGTVYKVFDEERRKIKSKSRGSGSARRLKRLIQVFSHQGSGGYVAWIEDPKFNESIHTERGTAISGLFTSTFVVVVEKMIICCYMP